MNKYTFEIPNGIKILNDEPQDPRGRTDSLSTISGDSTYYVGYSPIFVTGESKSYKVSGGDYVSGWIFEEIYAASEINELNDIGDVNISGATNDEVLTYENGYWVNKTPTGGGSAFPEWELNTPITGVTTIIPDLNTSDVDEYIIDDGVTSLLITGGTNISGDKGRKKYIIINNSYNNSSIEVIQFDSNYVFPVGTKPNSLEATGVATMELFNNYNNVIRTDWVRDE